MAWRGLGSPYLHQPIRLRQHLRFLWTQEHYVPAGRPGECAPEQGVQISGPSVGEDACLDGAAAIKERLDVITPIDPVPPEG